MTKTFAAFGVVAVLLAATIPLSAQAQTPEPPKKAAPARPAPHPVARPAPHPIARIAPHPIARVAPHPVARVAPHPVARIAPHPVPHRAASAPRRGPPPAIRHVERHAPNVAPAAHAAPAQANVQERLRGRHDEHAQQHQAQPAANAAVHAQPNANAIVASPNANASTRAGFRHNRQARITPQAARQGRFAALAPQAQAASPRVSAANFRASHTAARRAWHGGHRAGFVGWYGPVFYPYAYSDIFDYAFWPDGYDDDYWYSAYDGFFDGVYYGEMGPPAEYTGTTAPPPSQPSYAAVRDLCQQPGNGITAWPIAEIETKVGLNGEQKSLLNDVKNAGAKAASVFKATCPSENAFPLTPPGRLVSMTARLDATLEAVQTVRPPLEKFYNSLSDEQKERFNEIGPSKKVSNEARAALPDDAKKCGEAKPGLTNLPIEQIADAVDPNAQQQAALDKLGNATVKAVGILQAACPSETPLTPPGRLQAIQTRLQAMINAANTVKPSLDSFYASLSNEQKARFDRLGVETAQDTTGSK